MFCEPLCCAQISRESTQSRMSEAGDESQFHYAWSTPAGGRAFESNANIDIHDSVVVNIG